jgi:hypothetical protein
MERRRAGLWRSPTVRADSLGRLGTLSALGPLLAIRSTGDAGMTIAEFRTQLTRLIKKGSIAGLSIDDMADELTEAAEDLPSIGETDTRSEYDPVGDVIASHRP